MYEKIPLKKILRNQYSYIICFRSYYILKKNLIRKATHAAINIHPSPPKYRGPGGVNYALYNNEKFFGVNEALIVRASVMLTVVEAEVASAMPSPVQPLK